MGVKVLIGLGQLHSRSRRKGSAPMPWILEEEYSTVHGTAALILVRSLRVLGFFFCYFSGSELQELSILAHGSKRDAALPFADPLQKYSSPFPRTAPVFWFCYQLKAPPVSPFKTMPLQQLCYFQFLLAGLGAPSVVLSPHAKISVIPLPFCKTFSPLPPLFLHVILLNIVPSPSRAFFNRQFSPITSCRY